MVVSTLCCLLSVTFVGLHAVHLKFGVDIHHEQAEQTVTHCLKNCSQMTADFIERKLNPKVTSRQSCYEKCLRTFGKQEFHGNRQVKRIKRDAPSVPTNPKRGNTAACEEAGNGKYRAVDKKGIALTFHKLGKTDRFYAKISWTPPPESVNWSGYKLIYITGKRRWDYHCKDLNKTNTSYIVDNSSYGLGENDHFRVKVLSLPQIDGDKVDYMRKNVGLTIKPTDAETQGTTSSSPNNKTSQEKVVIPTVSVSITIGVVVVVYWYIRRLKKTNRQLGSDEVEFDA